ncbi:MAG: isochorismatase family protein [Caldilineaceae bacterium]
MDTVIIADIAINVCCETTAREARVRDFRVFFPRDGTTIFGMGDGTNAEFQKATLAKLGLVFVHFITLSEMVEQIQHAVVVRA